MEKRLIYKFEAEAQELEQLEERLIQELQETQDEEREAYKELEEAMIEASVGKRERLGLSLKSGDRSFRKSTNLPGLNASIGLNTSYGGFDPVKKSSKSGRNGTHHSGKSMRIANQVSTKAALNMNKTATGF